MGDFWKPHLRGKDRGLGNKEAQHIHTSTHNLLVNWQVWNTVS